MENCPEIDLLRQVANNLSEKVRNFETCVRSEYIDRRKERHAQQVTQREMERLEETRTLAEHAILSKTDMDGLELLQNKIITIIDDARIDVVKYQMTMIIFNARQDEYNQTNIVARQFMTPRTRFARAWEDEEQRSSSALPAPEVNFFVIVILVFATLVTVSVIASRVPITSFSRRGEGILENIKGTVLKGSTLSNVAQMKESIAYRLTNCSNWASNAAENATKLEL